MIEYIALGASLIALVGCALWISSLTSQIIKLRKRIDKLTVSNADLKVKLYSRPSEDYLYAQAINAITVVESMDGINERI